jgi:hypothetical protein
MANIKDSIIFLLKIIYDPFTNHVIEFILSMEWSLKLYSITNFKLLFFKSIYIIYIYIYNFNMII